MTENSLQNSSKLEKEELKIAFIPIICSAPLIYAHSHGFFEKNGLSVKLTRPPGWSGIKELLIHNHVDAAHMLSPMPLACALGIDGKKADIRLATVQNVNGQALTLANKHLGIKDVRDMKGFTFGVPYRFSMHYYLLCYFLAANGINPLKDVTIKEVAPQTMPFYLKKGWVDGVFAPEPFNQLAVYQRLGFIYILSKDIWPGHPCCSFATSQDFIDRYPNTYQAMLKSVLEAELALHKADIEQRKAIAREISGPIHLNQEDPVPVEQALAGDFPDGKGGEHKIPDRIDFIPDPWHEYGIWMLSQMQRWAQLQGKIDYREVVESVFETKEVFELAEALGFATADKPRLKGIHPFTGKEGSTYMLNQPYCAFQEEVKPLTKVDLSETARDHLSEVTRHMADVTGGNLETKIEITADGEIGQLQQLFNEMNLNMKFMRDKLIEQNERLQEQITERKQVERKMRHINRMLLAVRNVEQLIAKEKGLDRLLKGVCDNFIETRGYYNAWIAILDESGGLMTTAEAGLRKDFLPMVDRLNRGELTGCARRALMQSDVVVTEDPSSTCIDCPLSRGYTGRGAMTVRLEYRGKVYGLLSVSVPVDVTVHNAEKSLFKDVAGDIALGLRNIELEKERNETQEEKRKLETQILQSEKMASIGQLAAGVAHEINNPTGFISSNLNTLAGYDKDLRSLIAQYSNFIAGLKDAMATEKGRASILEKLDRISEIEKESDIDFVLDDTPNLIKECREGTERIKKIVIDLKDFAHPGEQKLQYADINKNMESTLNVVWNELKYKAKVIKEYGDLPQVKCYPQQLNQIFVNLLVNAAQAIEKKGEIRISTRKIDDSVEIKISDTGAGIPKENLSKIFDPFFTTKELGKGTGLGMNVAYNIIKKHKGTINVDSVVGKGTTFTIRIPIGH